MSDLIAYKSNALVEASYKLTLQEQRFFVTLHRSIEVWG